MDFRPLTRAGPSQEGGADADAPEAGEGGGPRGSVYLWRVGATSPIRLGDGKARSLSRDGKWVATIVPGSPPDGGVVDTVGAGDAFAAVVAVGLLEDWDPIASVARADELARRIVGVRGALPSDPSLYRRLRAAWRDAG